MTAALTAAGCAAAAMLAMTWPGRSPALGPRPTSSFGTAARPRHGRSARRARAAAVAEALTVLDSIGPALRAGLAPSTALAHLAAARQGPVGLADDLAMAAGLPGAPDRLPAGASAVGRVWLGWAQRSGAPELQLVAAAWTLADYSGVALADAVDLAARLLRESRARQSRLDVVLAGPRATMTLLTALPVAGPVVGLLFGITPFTLYAGSPLSMVAAVTGLALLVVGRLWCRRLLRGSMSAGQAPARLGTARFTADPPRTADTSSRPAS
ncbi:MAG: type II secretion system F family protein [Dermatophilaceae bacterium]